MFVVIDGFQSLLRLPVLFCLLFISINSFFQHKLLIIGPYHRAY